MGREPPNPDPPGDDPVASRFDTTETLRRWSPLIPPEADTLTSLGPPSVGSPSSPALCIRTLRVEPADGTEGAAAADYEVLEPIGSGGMGTVHSGRQRSLDRPVALKILDTRRSTPEDRAQFLNEASAMGRLEHPNIVPIHELGEDASGRLFYAMKLVRGVPWNRCLGDTGLEENLEILLRVCDAVAFAHSHGIIHRDLKPHNVMLGEFGEVLVVDWGLAVGVGDDARLPPLTAANAMAGTAAYMPPEMALGEPSAIGFHSDIYLLGAILFQIVTGRPPHGGRTVVEAILAAASNVIQPHGESGELLDIAMKAMATAPRDRHPSVADLQTAIRQYLSHEESILLCHAAEKDLGSATERGDYEAFRRSIFGFEQALKLWRDNARARRGLERARDSWARLALAREDLDLADSLVPGDGSQPEELVREIQWARLRRDSRRRRVKLLARTAAVLTLAVVVVLSVSLAAILRERGRVRRAEALAARQRNVALATLDTIVNEADAQLANRPAMEPVRARLLELALDGLGRMDALFPEHAGVDLRLAAAHQSMARIYHAARRNRKALEHQRRAVSILEELARTGTPVPPLELAAARRQLGDILHNYAMGDLEAARSAYRQALSLMERAAALEPSHRLELALLYQDLGDVALDLEDTEEADLWYAREAGIVEELAALHPHETAVTTALSDSLMRRGDLAQATGREDEAAATYRRALEVLAEAPGNDPTFLRRRVLVIQRLGEIAAAAPGGSVGARARFEEARKLGEELVARDPSNGQYRRDLLVTLWYQGDLERDAGRPTRARTHYLEAIGIAEDLLALNKDNAEARRDLFICCNRVGDIAMATGDLHTAESYYRRGLGISTTLATGHPGNLTARTDLVVSHYKLGELAERSGDCPTAIEHWRSCLRILQELHESGRIAPRSRYAPWLADVRDRIEACRS